MAWNFAAFEHTRLNLERCLYSPLVVVVNAVKEMDKTGFYADEFNQPTNPQIILLYTMKGQRNKVGKDIKKPSSPCFSPRAGSLVSFRVMFV